MNTIIAHMSDVIVYCLSTIIFASIIRLAMDPNAVISFDNTQNAFAYKTDKELKKARFLFKSMGYQWLVKLGTSITPWAIRIGLPVKGLIRKTIFQQFVGAKRRGKQARLAKKWGSKVGRAI